MHMHVYTRTLYKKVREILMASQLEMFFNVLRKQF